MCVYIYIYIYVYIYICIYIYIYIYIYICRKRGRVGHLASSRRPVRRREKASPIDSLINIVCVHICIYIYKYNYYYVYIYIYIYTHNIYSLITREGITHESPSPRKGDARRGIRPKSHLKVAVKPLKHDTPTFKHSFYGSPFSGPPLEGRGMDQEFRDALFEDVGFEHNRLSTLSN